MYTNELHEALLRKHNIYNFIRQDWQQNKNGRKKNLN